MDENYDLKLEGAGSFCSIVILSQEGPICKEVCDVTLKLLKLAEECWNPKSMSVLGKALRSQGDQGLAQYVGSGLHGRLYDLAKRAQRAGWLPGQLKITRPANRKIDPTVTRPFLNSSAGPDFVLNGKFGNSDVVAAWDLTTSNSLASHYDRDVLGVKRNFRPANDDGIQQVVDHSIFWTSYIAICY